VSWIGLMTVTPMLTAVGYFSGRFWVLPLLQAAAAYPWMVLDLRRGGVARALPRMLVWALLIAVSVEALTFLYPSEGTTSVLNGGLYREEMLRWIRTGIGKESSPSQFLPEHLLHLAAFLLLSLATGGFLALLLGAVMMNYMSFYVGSLLLLSVRPVRVIFCGWPPWAILRVIAFVILGVVLSGPVLARLARVPFRWKDQVVWLKLACAGILLDIVLKTALADTWSRLLRAALPPTTGF
jgi:hypothetical protein